MVLVYVRGLLIQLGRTVHKKTAKVDIEDLFGDETASDHELFAEPTVDQTTTTCQKENAKSSSTSTSPVGGSSTTQRRASASSNLFKRSALLDKNINFLKPRLGPSPSKKQPKIRSRAWLTMMHLAKDGEDMRKVVDLIPILHQGGGALPGLFVEGFVREWPAPCHFTLKPISHHLFRSLRAARLPISCPRGVRQLCKI